MSETTFISKEWKQEIVKPVFADLSENNEYITETAGFIPLEVKFKQFEQNGLRAQFDSKEFSSSDYRDMYLNPDFEIYPGDELEEAQEKLDMQRAYINELLEKKKALKKDGSFEKTAVSPSGSAAATTDSAQTSEPKDVPQQ